MLHTALRGTDAGERLAQAREVQAVRKRMAELVRRVRAGDWAGWSGEPVRDVVNIGIGGSHLGPVFATEALGHLRGDSPRCHFVSNVDPRDLEGVLAGLAPARTLFIVASKSFGTLETLENALLGAALAAGRGMSGHGAGPPLPRGLVERAARGRLRHRRGQRAADVGLGRRALLAVVGDRAADRDGGGHGGLRRAARGRARDGPAFPRCAARVEHAHVAGADRRVVPQFPRRRLAGGDSLRPVAAAAAGVPAAAGDGEQRQVRRARRHAAAARELRA